MKKLNRNIELFVLIAVIVLFQSFDVNCSVPVIIEHPEDIIVAKNEPVTLRCEAEGDPQPEISWFKDGKQVTTAINGHNTHRLLLPSGSLFFLRAVYSRKEDDGGVYFCQAENSDGMTRSKNATLTVAVLRDKFRLEPEDQGVERGQTARLVCSPPKGMPTPTVFWKKNGKFIDLEKEERIHLEGEGDLVIENVSDEDEGKYQCLAKNIVGTRSTEKAELQVQVKPFVVKHPENISIVAGEEIRLACVVGGRPPPEIRWWRQTGQLPPNRVVVSDNSLLTVRNVIPDDEDIYVCQGENSVGSVQALANVQIHSPPIFLVEPTDQKVAEGAPAVLDCIAAGNPTPTLFWMKESDSNILLPGSTTSHVTVTPEGTLRIVSVSADTDSGWYSCAAVSESGSCLARAEVAVARDSDRPPPILQLGPVNQTLPLGSTASLPCQATSQETLITWLKDGVPLDSVEDRISLDDENTLTIKELSFSDTGLYTCQARSASGQAVWSASLNVADPSNASVQFKTMPYFSQFPASPSMPVFVNATSASITVAWDKPHRIGGSPLKGYQLDYYTLATPSHWLTIQDVRQEVFTLTKLPPLTTILVLVRAVNDHGLSPPSPVSKPMKTTTKIGSEGGKDDLLNNKALDKNPSFIRLRLSQRVLELQEAVSVTSRKVKLQWELLSAKLYVEGYHIHVRDLTSRELSYDVVTISGGPTRSHTLSDLRPNTRYSIFLVPYNKKIKGRPSNMKIVTTREDVPTSSPENVEVQQFNASSVLIQWSPPLKRDLHGDLKGYKVTVEIEPLSNESSSSGLEFNNFTLEPEVTSLVLHNLSSTSKYIFRVAAYNRQGIGPFSASQGMKIDRLLTTTTLESPTFADQAHFPQDVAASGGGTEVGGIDLIVQEVWFVAVMALMVLIVLIAFVATIWVRRQRSNMKNLGHYNVPVHKVDDITHVNFTDRDHLWFDPNWTKSNADSSGSENKIGNNDDPMAAMLENNCKNRNATNIFINKLAQLNAAAPEYAEVEGMKGLPGILPTNNGKRLMQTSHQQGPYATTTLVEPGNSNGSSAHHSNTSTATSMANGAVLTPTPLRNNSMGKANGSVNNKSGSLNNHINNSNNRMNHEETDTPSGVNGLSDKDQNLASMTSSSSGSNSSKRPREPSQPPPPLPPPPAEALMLNYFSSPQASPASRLMNGARQSSVSDARLYNRSLMSGAGPDGIAGPSPPPAPPARGPSSYNGVRTGSFASFGHLYPHDPRLFGAPLQQTNGFSHSHYSVPGMFYHHPHPAMHPGCCPSGVLPTTSMSGSQTEDQYESASVCYAPSAGAMVGGPIWLSHQNPQSICSHAPPQQNNTQCNNGFDDHEIETDCCDDQGWEWDSGEDEDCVAEDAAGGCDVEEESFYAGSEFGDGGRNVIQNKRRTTSGQQNENGAKQNGDDHLSVNHAKRRLSNRSTHSNTEDDHNEKLRQVSMSAQATPVCGRRRRSQPRPSSVCSTDSNFSSVSTHYHHQMGFDPTGNQHFSGNGYGHRRQHRLHQRRNHGGSAVGSNGSQNKSNQVTKSGEIYSTFKPPLAQLSNSSSMDGNNKHTGNEQHIQEKTSPKNADETGRLNHPLQNTSDQNSDFHQNDQIRGQNVEAIKHCEDDENGLFAQVSQDMSEMVEHLNTIQNDISELAGRPISLYDNS